MDDLTTTDACTLPTADRPIRRAEFDAPFVASARTVTRDEHGVRIHLVGKQGLREQVRDLAERETACCSFLDFVIEDGDDDLVLAVSVPAERRECCPIPFGDLAASAPPGLRSPGDRGTR